MPSLNETISYERNQYSSWHDSRLRKVANRVIGMAGLVVAAPVIGVAATAIYLETGDNPFFRQQRYGQNGKMFAINKLRTLPGDDHGTDGHGRDDERATKVGRILRQTRLDELPQLWNIAMGHMYINGPRAWNYEHKRAMEAANGDDFPAIWDAYTHTKPGLFGKCVMYNSLLRPETYNNRRKLRVEGRFVQQNAEHSDIISNTHLTLGTLAVCAKAGINSIRDYFAQPSSQPTQGEAVFPDPGLSDRLRIQPDEGTLGI